MIIAASSSQVPLDSRVVRTWSQSSVLMSIVLVGFSYPRSTASAFIIKNLRNIAEAARSSSFLRHSHLLLSVKTGHYPQQHPSNVVFGPHLLFGINTGSGNTGTFRFP
jgi:hypothetical protein